MTTFSTRSVTREAIEHHFVAASARATGWGHPVVASISQRCPEGLDPLAFFDRHADSSTFRAYWEHPIEARALVAIGVAHSIETGGEARFRDAEAGIQADLATAAIGNQDLAGPPGDLLYLGGFAFDPAHRPEGLWDGFPAGLLVLPRLLLTRHGNGTMVTFNAVVAPGDDGVALAGTLCDEFEARSRSTTPRRDESSQARAVSWTETPGRHQWERQVATVTREIRAGRFEKVVLARRLTARATAPFDTASALRQLREAYPAAFIFAFSRGRRTFLGATPELLVRRAGSQVEATSLAGSAPRGQTPAEDAALAAALLASAKDHVEHAIVARAIQEALAPWCDDIFASATPEIMRMRNVQHLYTPIRGRLGRPRSLLELLERLHPTPAVGGYPRDPALAAIHRHEDVDRGWYAGPVGWVNASGDGEFGVAIRSALLHGTAANFYAGCGLVGDSDPATEYDETLPKLRPMLDALGLRP